MEKTSKFFAYFIRCLGICIVGYLFLQGLFTVCAIQRVTERSFYVSSHALYAIVGIVIFFVIFWILYRFAGSVLERCERGLVLAGMLATGAFLIWWNSRTQFWYWGDEEKIFQCADMYLAGDYSEWMQGGYAYMWKHQNGVILFAAALLKIFGLSGTYWIFRVVNILFYELTLFLLWRTLRKLFADKRIVVIQMTLLMLFFPYGFYCLMLYGNVIGLGFAVLAVYCMITYLETDAVRMLWGSAVAMIFSIIFKQNDAIILVGLLMLLILQPARREKAALMQKEESALTRSEQSAHARKGEPAFMRKGKAALKKAGIAGGFALVVLMGVQVPNILVEAHTGIDLSGTGNSMYAHIAMGLQDSEVSPGWYNTYNEAVFVRNGYDKEETAREAKQSIRATLQYYAQNPMEGWSFINRKLASEWNNPTFEGFHMQNARLTAMELSTLVKSVINDGGKLNILLIFFLDIYESVILFGILLYLTAVKDADIKELLFIILLIGAFVFFAVWEAKGRYVAPFYLMVIPYAAVGYQKLFEGGRRFETTKKLALIMAALVVCISLCNLDVVTNSLKLGSQSEEYYDYIHEFNKNFINFKY